MASATKYVDNVNGNNGNTGNSEAQAYADIPTAIAAISGAGNIIYVQAGANYALTATIAFTAALKGDITTGRNRIEGYTTTPGARDGRPVITSATDSVALFTLNDNDFWEFRHLKLTHTAATRGLAFAFVTSASSPLFVIDVVCDGCLSFTPASSFNAGLRMDSCEVKNCTSTTAAVGIGGLFYGFSCDIHDNAGSGILGLASNTTEIDLQDCIIDTNGVVGVDCVNANNNIVIKLHGCIVVDNVGDGLDIPSIGTQIQFELQNNVFYGNGGKGIDSGSQVIADAGTRVNRSNAYGSNTGGAYSGIGAGAGEVTLTADPFTNRAGRDFSPNTTAGGGAALRTVGFPHTYVSGTTTGNKDIGVQHAEATGLVNPIISATGGLIIRGA